MKNNIRVCAVCGKEFSCRPSKNKKTCGAPECRSEYASRIRIGKPGRPYNPGNRPSWAEDLTGQTFDLLKVTGRAEKKGDTYWLCECSCGNTTIVASGALKNSIVKSCGCYHKDVAKKNLDILFEADRFDGTQISKISPKKLQSNNTSGVRGVSWDQRKQKWSAGITLKKKKYFLGNFENLEDARKARERAEEEMFDPIIERYNEEKNSPK